MQFHKVTLNSELSIANEFIYIYSMTPDNKLIFRRYIKEYIIKVDDLEDFSTETGATKMKHPTDENISLFLVANLEIDLNNIPSHLCSENANILYAITLNSDVGFYNRDIETYVSKADNGMTRSLYNHSVIFNLFKPRKNGPVENVIFHINNEEDYYINIPDVINNGTTYPVLDKLTIDIIGEDMMAPNSLEAYTLQVKDSSGNDVAEEGIEIHVKSDCGLLSHNKLVTDSFGKARLKVKSDMLDTEDKIVIKVGFKYYSNINNKVISIV